MEMILNISDGIAHRRCLEANELSRKMEMRNKTRPYTRLPMLRAGGQGQGQMVSAPGGWFWLKVQRRRPHVDVVALAVAT